MPSWFRNPGRSQAFWMFALCGIAALRIALYCSAFPFFTNVDEPLHFDLIWKYSRGEWPSKGSGRMNAEADRHITYFASPEYLYKSSDFRGGRFPEPVWNLPEIRREQVVAARAARRGVNHEEHSPPLYYAAAGAWLRLGEFFGLQEARLLYWIRFLNVPLYLTLLALSFHAGRRFFPGRPALALGLPVLVAFFPQDVFYSLNSDVLTPIPCTLAFIITASLLVEGHSGLGRHAALGAAAAAGLLVKLANLPVLIWAALAIAGMGRGGAAGTIPRRRRLLSAGTLLLTFALPVALWALRNQSMLGDWTGARHKIDLLGWTYKPISELLPHPILTLEGAGYFLHNLLASFWRGEFTWGLQRISLPAMDAYYTWSTILLLSAAAFFSLRGLRHDAQSRVVALGLAGVAAALAYQVLLSVAFDFNQCFYPSRRYPFFVSGRLLLCVMFPILIAYAYGLEKLMGLFGQARLALPLLVLQGLVVTLAEIYLSLPALGSPYNLWHLPSGSLFR
jgi:hypothetical protein